MSKPTHAELAALLAQHNSVDAVASAVGASRSVVRGWYRTLNDGKPSEDEGIEVTAAQLGDMDQLLRDRGLSPQDWVVAGLTVNEWGDPDAPMRQLKARLAPRGDLLRPADGACKPIPLKPAIRDASRPELWVICSDHHAPYHDPALHACMLQFIRDTRPDRGALLGDTLDLPTISRFVDNPPFVATPQQCVQAAFEMLRDYRLANRSTRWVKIKGNHDDRIRNEQLNRAERLYALRPADDGTVRPDPHSVGTLLHLDALSIEFSEPEGSYERGRVPITGKLEGRHGKRTGPGAGAKTLQGVTYSTVMGHTHVKRDHWATRWGMGGVPEVLRAVEVGTMAMIAGGLGYTDDPGWQQGFVTVSAWPDGEFTVDHATFSGGTLLWRDRRWTASVDQVRLAA